MNTISESVYPRPVAVELAVRQDAPSAVDGQNPGDFEEDDGFQPFGTDGFTFLDFLDIINPLQHIPVIGTLYRQMTGDEIDPASRVMGSTLFFGPIGTVASLANVMVSEATGKDVGEHVLAFFNDEEPGAPEVAGVARETTTELAVLTADTRPDQVDPVTAWAMAEVAFRKSTADQITGPAPREAAVVSEIPPSPASAEPSERAAQVPKLEAFLAALGIQSVEPSSFAPEPRTLADIGWRTQMTEAEGRRSGESATATTEFVARDTRRSATPFAAASYDRPQSRAGIGTATPAAATPPGATAAHGGWFSQNMLSAYGKYEDSARLFGDKQPATIDMMR